MKNTLSIATIVFSFSLQAQSPDFIKDAQLLVKDLKSSLMGNLSKKIAQDGVEKAIPFCHAEVGTIAKGVAKDRLEKYQFGRTSHKIRNEKNKPQAWADKYLKDFAGKKKDEIKKDYILTKSEDGKNIYMEPLYIEARCLLCHGNNISKNVSAKIGEFYPKDKATGFKLGEFRGFIWVKENSQF